MKLVVLSPHLVIITAQRHDEARHMVEAVEAVRDKLQKARLTVLVFGGVDEVIQQLDLGPEPTPEQVEEIPIETLKGVLRA